MDITQPILEAIVLEFHNILVDTRNEKLIDAKTGLLTPGMVIHTDIPTARTIRKTEPFPDLLIKYPTVIKPMNDLVQPKHEVKH